MSTQELNIRPQFDREIVNIVDYVMNYEISSKPRMTLRITVCSTRSAVVWKRWNTRPVKLLGPVCGTLVPNGARVPGTQFQLDPVQAAFNIGAMIRWLDFNDTACRRVGPSF